MSADNEDSPPPISNEEGGTSTNGLTILIYWKKSANKFRSSIFLAARFLTQRVPSYFGLFN